ncbi:hypothetical protein [Streptomyces sp. NBC_00366]|uniref:hypothetical protein n=1 Tax=Streptomyces sp. NBC_00366 TaxID=2975727 RepID=UPI002E261B34
MGIRMLNRRPARAQASAEAASAAPPAPMPAFAARASTARIPTDLVVVLRRTAKRLRRPAPTPGEPSVWRLWAGLGRSYLTALIARTRHARAARATPTIPVFIVTTGTLTERRDGGAGR